MSESWAGAPPPGVGVSRGASSGGAYGQRWRGFIHSAVNAPSDPSSACKAETGTDFVLRELGPEREAGNWVSQLLWDTSVEERGCAVQKGSSLQDEYMLGTSAHVCGVGRAW